MVWAQPWQSVPSYHSAVIVDIVNRIRQDVSQVVNQADSPSHHGQFLTIGHWRRFSEADAGDLGDTDIRDLQTSDTKVAVAVVRFRP